MRTVEVRPDVTGFDRTFSYLLPDNLSVDIGTIVRVPLHNRRVRGWVVSFGDAEIESHELQPIIEIVSAGPPTKLVELCDWIAWRYTGNPVVLLRSASPPNLVSPDEFPSETQNRGGPHAVHLEVTLPQEDRLALIKDSIAEIGSTLVLIPGARRAAALAKQLQQIGINAVAYVGNDAQRTRAWRTARTGNIVVVGGRIAALAPVPDLASVVLLDDADEAYKEERSPNWHAREVILERARRIKASVTFATPLPTLEALHAAGNVHYPDMPREGWPLVDVVDQRDDPGVLSRTLARHLQDTKERGERTLCFLNRKGRANLLICDACGAPARCEVCSTYMHEQNGELQCALCESRRPKLCIACGHPVLKRLRLGVAGLAEQLSALIPSAVVQDITAETAEVRPADIYIGTEAAFHRVPRDKPFGLVAFLEFDQELLAPRYRSSEQAAWLLVRASRLLRTRHSARRLLIQTRMPDHEVIETVLHGDVRPLLSIEEAQRRALTFPPFGGLAVLRGDAEALNEAKELATQRGVNGIFDQSGNVMLRAQEPEILSEVLERVLPKARKHGRIRAHVDPLRV